jgi:3-oxoacyl-[acyl-carrier-protein] synthase II
MDKKEKRIVITGIGTVSPCGLGKEKFWNYLEKGKSAIRDISTFDTTGLKCKKAGEVRNFNLKRLVDTTGIRFMVRSTHFALAGTSLALNDAKLKVPIPEQKAKSYGVALGVATGSVHSLVFLEKSILTKGARYINPQALPNGGPNATTSQLSISFNIKGFNTTIGSSFSSGTDAIFYASNMIRNYGYKVVLVGSVEELGEEVLQGLIRRKCLSGSKSSRAKEISRPYDGKRNGFVLGEGASVMVIEDLEHARKRKAKIYAEVKGQGFSFAADAKDSFSNNKESVERAMKQALYEFGYPKRNIDYIAGCANATLECDYIESEAIKGVFKEKSKDIPVSSIKSIIGESLSAGSSFNVASAVGAIERGFIPPTINYKNPDKKCDLNIVANKRIKKDVNNVLVTAFDYSGFNSAIVIGKVE